MSDQLFTGKEHTENYRIYRPTYPKAIFEHIINYYFDGKNTNEKIPMAVDIACGSGQATVDLSLYCERVIGTDVSENQIANAIPKENIEYRCSRGEDLSFLPSNSVDLVTIATALHWLDIDRFFKEVKRVLKPQIGVLAVWTYAYGTLDNSEANEINRQLGYNTLRPYWNEKQHLVDNYYQSILPLFPYQSTLQQFIIERQLETTIDGLLCFIQTTSACQTFRKQSSEQIYHDTLNTFRQKLVQCYVKSEIVNANDQTTDFDSIKINISSPIRLYLMKKHES